MNQDTPVVEERIRKNKRKSDAYRDIKIETSVSKNAEGSARCILGETEVIVGVKLDIGQPYPDSPDEGSIMVTAELSPLASPNFELGPPGNKAIELARIVDRGIRESKCIDLKKLCIKKGEKSWTVFIDIYPQNDAGNLIDASALAAAAALEQAKLPKLVKDLVQYGELSTKSLPVKDIPIACTFGKIKNNLILDPDDSEEKILDARLTITTVNGNIHAMQKGETHGLTLKEVEYMITAAIQKEKDLRKLL